MINRWRRALTATVAALALGLMATPAQADTADPTAAPDQTAADQAFPDPTYPDETYPDEAVPDPIDPDEAVPDPDTSDLALLDPAAGPDQLGLSLSVRIVSGSFGTTATGITFEPTLTGCRLTVPGFITFPGPNDPDPDPAIVGTARAVTTAWVNVPCADARATPPGTYADTFVCTGTFTGTVEGVPVTARLGYQGVTAPGGKIRAGLFINGRPAGASLSADARVLRGGTYSGIVWA